MQVQYINESVDKHDTLTHGKFYEVREYKANSEYQGGWITDDIGRSLFILINSPFCAHCSEIRGSYFEHIAGE